MNTALLKRLASAVLLSAVLAGLVLTAIQQIKVFPIIQQAETRQEAPRAGGSLTTPHSHRDVGAPAVLGHKDGGWGPKDGAERFSLTAFANLAMAVGFGLFLAAAIVVSGKNVSWRTGLVWGLAGYAVFFVAPSLRLPPELPGTDAAALGVRQLWWLLTVGLTGGGLSLLVFSRHGAGKLAGIVLVIAPQLLGAPHPEVSRSLAPSSLIHSFIVATALVNALFWLLLGGLIGFFYRKVS